MKLASVTFSGRRLQVGGAQIPAIAFQQWCEILGVDCDYIDFNTMSDHTALNMYDAVFFCTPISELVLEKAKLEVPFASMIHAEFDDWLVTDKANDKAEVVVVIDQTMEYWGFEKQCFWHPCTLPQYLIDGNEIFGQNKTGLVYSARLSTWKNALMLAGLSHLGMFKDVVGDIDVYGLANSAEYMDHINLLRPRWNHNADIYDVKNFEHTSKKFIDKNYFWDVCGSSKYEICIPRLNLAAFEAMKFGCVPIVDYNSITPDLHGCCVDLSNIDIIKSQNKRDIMIETVMNSHASYPAVKKQVEEIIHRLTEKL